MPNNTIEIIEIDLGINLEEEIKQKVDSLNANITLYTKELIKRASKKQKTVNKKKLDQDERSKQADKAIEILKNAYEKEDIWLKGWDLVQQSGMEPTPQNVNKLSMLVAKTLKETKKFALLKKRHRGKMQYRLTLFS